GWWGARGSSGRRAEKIPRDIEKLNPVATTIPTTAAASRCRAKNPIRIGRYSRRVKLSATARALLRAYVTNCRPHEPPRASLNVRWRLSMKFHNSAIAIDSAPAIARFQENPNRGELADASGVNARTNWNSAYS